LVVFGLDSGTIIIEEWLVTGEVQAHETGTSMVKAAPAGLEAGTDMALKVRLSCPEQCDLQGGKVRIVDEEGAAVKEIELVTFDGTGSETDEFVVQAPIKPGGCTWTALFPAQEKEGVLHEESSTSFSFIVKPHATSIAVWDVPSPIAFGDKFKLKVGVKCSADCKLTGKEVEIYDQEGGEVATKELGGVPWAGTTALYWAEVELEAPSAEGYYTWEVKFPKPDLEFPHEGASSSFSFTTARPPEHAVTVEVIAQDTKTPIKNAHVLLRPHSGYPYRSYTDEGGVTKLEVPKGKHELYVSKSDYDTFQTSVEVASDLTIKAELSVEEKEWWEGP
jgi:hypothetical protein